MRKLRSYQTKQESEEVPRSLLPTRSNFEKKGKDNLMLGRSMEEMLCEMGEIVADPVRPGHWRNWPRATETKLKKNRRQFITKGPPGAQELRENRRKSTYYVGDMAGNTTRIRNVPGKGPFTAKQLSSAYEKQTGHSGPILVSKKAEIIDVGDSDYRRGYLRDYEKQDDEHDYAYPLADTDLVRSRSISHIGNASDINSRRIIRSGDKVKVKDRNGVDRIATITNGYEVKYPTQKCYVQFDNGTEGEYNTNEVEFVDTATKDEPTPANAEA